MSDIKIELKTLVEEALKKNELVFDSNLINIEQVKDNKNGDYSTSVAMRFASKNGLKPVELANKLVPHLTASFIDKVAVAGPGFINFYLKGESMFNIIKKVIEEGENYGRSERNGTKINVEFVSANPTGDLHLGHARIASYGDSMCRLYDFAGYDVTREYYINDCGNQINNLGLSVQARYHELFGEEITLPPDGYHAADIIEIAKQIKAEFGDKYLEYSDENLKFFTDYGKKAELEKIKKDLAEYRVVFDVYTAESDIRKNNRVENVLKNDYKDFTYEQDGAIFLKTSDFLDDKDRPVVKSDGAFTYLMPDIVYHLDKLSRGYNFLVDLLGADHHGYINRLKSAMMMKGYPASCIEVELVQIVRLMKNGEEVKMSKRTGNAVTMKELIEEVGVDAARYFFVSRDGYSHLDFDIDLAKDHSEANPLFYAQYAHARLCRMLTLASDIPLDEEGKYLGFAAESALSKEIIAFPSIVKNAAESRKPNKITTYIQSLATLIHEFYTKCRVIDREHLDVSSSRLALVKASSIVLENALNLLGLSAPTNM